MENDLFERTPIARAYLKLSLPVVFSGVLTLVYNMVDMYFIAKTGDTDLVAGVALCAPMFTLLIALGDIMGLGGSSVISRLLGQGKKDDGRRLSVFFLDGSFILGVFMACLFLIFRNPILALLGADAATLPHASAYYFWIALGSPFVILALSPTNLLRTEGAATASMIGSVLGSITNIILDPVFIFGLNMGAGGAAAATVIGNIVSDCFFVWYIIRKSSLLAFKVKNFHISSQEVKNVLGIGIPSSITNIMQSIGVIVLNHALLAYGNESVAAMGIVSKVTMIVIMVMVGFSFGGQPLYGYLYGAKLNKRFRGVLKFAISLIVGLAAAMSVVIAVFAPAFISFFMKDPSIISMGSTMLRIVLIGMPFIGLTMVITCVFQSCGKALPALVLSAGRQGIFYIVILFITSSLFHYYGVLMGQPVSDIFTSIVALFLLKKHVLSEVGD